MMSVCLRYANDSMEAEDMIQDAFIKGFINIWISLSLKVHLKDG